MMRKNQTGFTTVELLTAIFVLGIAVISIASLFSGTQIIQNRTERLDIATRAAQRQVETLRNQNYNSLTPGQSIDFTASLPSALPNAKSGIVAVSEPATGLRRVDVTITYNDSGKQRQVKLSSLIGDIGITQ